MFPQDIERKPFPRKEGLAGLDDLRQIGALQVGGLGAKVFKADDQGMWLGASKFVDAPFSVDMLGNVVASSATFSAYATTAAALLRAGTGQTLSGDFLVGGANIKIDGTNNRILIIDASADNRIVIGNV